MAMKEKQLNDAKKDIKILKHQIELLQELVSERMLIGIVYVKSFGLRAVRRDAQETAIVNCLTLIVIIIFNYVKLISELTEITTDSASPQYLP